MRKKILFIFSIFLLGAVLVINTYAVPTPKNEITLNPFGLGWGFLNLEYEYVLSQKGSVAFRLDFYDRGFGAGWDESGFGLGASYRFFLIDVLKTKSAPGGFWIGPALDIISYSYTYYQWNWTIVPERRTGIYFAIYCEAGYEWLFEDLFGNDVHLVLAPYFVLGFVGGGVANSGFGGMYLDLRLSVGVAF